MPTAKLDLYRKYRDEYAAKRAPALVKVVPAKYLSIAGEGKPGGKRFQECVGALYAMAFTIKMARKFAGTDYKVCQLEGQYWTKQPSGVFDVKLKDLQWKLLIRVPEFIAAKDVEQAVTALESRGRNVPFRDVKLETIREGVCVQQLHVGPYKTEPETLKEMASFAAEKAMVMSGLHHEIYLSDPRRVAPEKLKTILRVPVKQVAKAAAA